MKKFRSIVDLGYVPASDLAPSPPGGFPSGDAAFGFIPAPEEQQLPVEAEAQEPGVDPWDSYVEGICPICGVSFIGSKNPHLGVLMHVRGKMRSSKDKFHRLPVITKE
jgi:hypothetical protein